MKILIIGNQGYVGSALVEELKSKRKYKLLGLDLGIFSKNLVSNYNPDDLLDEQIIQDVRNFDISLLKDVKTVVYLAAISNDPMGNEYESLTRDINYLSCVRIAKEAKKAGVNKFIFPSSCSVYGFGGDLPKKEEDKLDPLTAYARSKIDCEESLYKLADNKFKIFSLRFATACGMSPRLRLDLVLNDFIANSILFKEINILSDGSSWRPLINVEDMSKAIIWAIEVDDNKINENFLCLNAGSDDWNYKIIDLAKEVSRIIGNVPIKIGSKMAVDKRSYKVDFGKFKKMTSKINIDNTLEKTIMKLAEGIKKIQFQNINFRNSDFIRLNVLRKFMKKI